MATESIADDLLSSSMTDQPHHDRARLSTYIKSIGDGSWQG